MINCESFRGVVKFNEDWRLKCRQDLKLNWFSFEWPLNVSQSISQHVSVGVLFLYCLILLQALNCCPQEDAKRYNRNSFVLNRLLSRPFFCKSFFLSFLFLHLTGFFSSFWQHCDHQSDDLHFFQCCHLLLLYFLSSVCLVSCAFFITTICFCVFCSLWWLGLLECHSGLKPTNFTPVLIQIKTYFWSI